MSFFGADVAELRLLAQRLAAAAESLESTGTEINGAVAVAQRWQGPDAEAFRERWRSHGRPSLGAASSALRDASSMLLSNADQQQEASASSGGAVTAPRGPSRVINPGDAELDESLEFLGKLWELFKAANDLAGLGELFTFLAESEGVISSLRGEYGAKIKGIDAVITVVDLLLTARRTWDDIQSGNIFRFGRAIFTTGWSIAKLLPATGGVVRAIDEVFSAATTVAEVSVDAVGGEGTWGDAWDGFEDDVFEFGDDMRDAARAL